MLIKGVEESFHFLFLKLLGCWPDCFFISLFSFFFGWLVNQRSTTQAGAQFERVNTTSVVTDQEDGVLSVEGNVQTLSLLHGSVLAEVSVLLLMEIVDKETTLIGTSGEHS